MFDSPRRATLLSLLLVLSGAVAAWLAGTLGGPFTVPWWMLVLGLCAGIPRGAATARSSRSRLVALGGVFVAALILVGGSAATESLLLILGVALPLWLALAFMITPQLHGHRLVGLAVFALPLLFAGGVVPLLVGPWATEPSPVVDLPAGFAAVAASTGPTLLLCGAAMLLGVVGDVVSLLRSAVSAATVRAVAFLAGGLTLLLVATAGALAAGTVAGIASRVGALGVLLVAAAAFAIRHGMRGLDSTGDISRAAGVLACSATGALFAGTALIPTGPMTWIAFVVLLGLAAGLGAVGGLCGAAALVRSRREPAPLRVTAVLRAVHGRIRDAVRAGLRARTAHS